jgi:plastocyanin
MDKQTKSVIWRVPTILLAAFLVGALSSAFNASSSNNTLPVVQQKKAFQPGELSVARGDVVLFKNEDTSAHNIVSRTAGFDFDLGLQETGQDRHVTLA